MKQLWDLRIQHKVMNYTMMLRKTEEHQPTLQQLLLVRVYKISEDIFLHMMLTTGSGSGWLQQKYRRAEEGFVCVHFKF